MPLHEVTLEIARHRGDPQGATARFLETHPEEHAEALKSFEAAQAIWTEDNLFPGPPVVHNEKKAWARQVAGNGSYEIIVGGTVVEEVDAAEVLARYVYMMYRA